MIAFPKSNKNNVSTQPQPFNVEIIEAITPIVMALIGGVLGMTVLLAEKPSEIGVSLASSAIAGAAGLAQSAKKASASAEKSSNLAPKDDSQH